MPVSRHGTWFMSRRMPTPPFARHFDRRGREAGGAHVLDGDDRVGRHQLEAGFDQQFLGERVADLHRGALFLAVLGEVGRLAMVAPWMPSRPVLEPT